MIFGEEEGLHEVRRLAQQALADALITALRGQGLVVGRVEYCNLATVEVALQDGIKLVPLPIAEVIWGRR